MSRLCIWKMGRIKIIKKDGKFRIYVGERWSQNITQSKKRNLGSTQTTYTRIHFGGTSEAPFIQDS